MKYKGILLAFAILILACSLQSAFAEDATAGNHTFTVPDNYVIAEQSGDLISIGDNDHTTYITIAFKIKETPDSIRKSLESSGEKYIDNKTMTVSGYNVTQINFEDTDGNNHYMYVCKKGNETIGINMLSKNKYADVGDNENPVTGILSSLKP